MNHPSLFFQFAVAPLLVFLFSFGSELNAQETSFQWPEGKKAAVCMTYDDGMWTHLAHAIPDLEAFGYRGTFYMTGDKIRSEEIAQWRAVADRGHELGAHSLFHPCNGEYDWVPDEYAIEDYTVHEYINEMKVMNTLLFAIDGKNSRSYAYPCHIKEAGGVYIVDTLSNAALFTGARNGYSPDPFSREKFHLFDIPSKSVKDDVPIADVKAYILKAIETGGVAAFCFHGVGGQYISTSREYHREILDFLKEHDAELWVAPLTEVAEWIGK